MVKTLAAIFALAALCIGLWAVGDYLQMREEQKYFVHNAIHGLDASRIVADLKQTAIVKAVLAGGSAAVAAIIFAIAQVGTSRRK